MKFILTLVTILSWSLCLIGQEEIEVITVDPESKSDTYNYSSVDQIPLFGKATNTEENRTLLLKYIQTQLASYKVEPAMKSYVNFIIDRDGSVIEVKVIYGKNDEFNGISTEIIKGLPQWKPAEHKGEKVKVSYTVDVKS